MNDLHLDEAEYALLIAINIFSAGQRSWPKQGRLIRTLNIQDSKRKFVLSYQKSSDSVT